MGSSVHVQPRQSAMTSLERTAPIVLLEGAFAARPDNGAAEFYSEPLSIIRADTVEEVPAALAAIDTAVAAGHWLAGYLAYELGYALERRLAPLMPKHRSGPLIAMGAFERPKGAAPDPSAGPASPPQRFRPALSAQDYRQAIERLLDYIRAGDIYQVNYTYPLEFEPLGDPWALYLALKAHQPVPYPAFVRLGGLTVLSLSPELFFRIEDGRITARPMKGTARRARQPAEDREAARALGADIKNRAENLMIVDLLRNDLSKLAVTGSVRVPSLFTLETYRTLHTMTSTIEADLKPNTPPSDILRALFPCGSVTGAPKIRAMEIIRELEPSPRGVYTGAIGVFRPDGSACFNVAIRTIEVGAEGRARLGVGGGIVADSDPQAEADEARLKARFLTALSPYAPDQAPLQLIETIRWTPGEGFTLVNEHLARLAASARYFGYPFDATASMAQLDERAKSYRQDMRVRAALGESGALTISDAPLGAADALWRYAISPVRIASDDPYRAHKTTRRGLYDDEHSRMTQSLGCDEVLFLNERGEVVEGSRTNLFVERDGVLLTPPLSSGALPGTLRASLLASREARESVLTPEDLGTGAVYLGNSVRGLIRAEPMPEAGAQAPSRVRAEAR